MPKPRCVVRKAIVAVSVVMFAMLTTCSYSQVVISEFMAANNGTLDDGDGNSSDWIELYNLGDSAVDLTGWYLSDDTNNLAKWVFPSKSIAVDTHLVVFASGQETAGYVDSLGYLHTNFKLNAGGESVILTQSDGVTIEHAFIDYPAQEDDISYGLEQDSGYSYLVVEEQDATAFVGTSEPSASWNTVGFNDSGWQSGQTGVGYDPGSTYGSMINLDLEGTMFDDSSRPPTFHNTAYIRVDFTVDDATAISQLALRMKYDDGFVAYINGAEVASANAPSSPVYNSVATADHNGTSYEDYALLNAGNYLLTGNNVLAIHGLTYPFDPRTSTGDPDFFIMPVLSGVSGGQLHTNTAAYLDSPTPGADNVQGVQGYVGDTTFSVDRGFFTTPTNVAISCKTEGAAIYYTTDGTTPATDNGTLYTTPITINKTTVLRAAAFVTGWQPSDVDTQTYLFLDDVIAQGTGVSGLAPYFPPSSVNGQVFDYGMDTDITQSSTYSGEIEGALLAIPSISIVTDPDNLFDSSSGIYVNADQEGEAWERETSVELIHPDGTKGFQINGGIRIRGESSTASSNPKHSFRFLFKSEYGTARLNYELFGDDGADSYKRMDLRTGQNFSWAHQTPQYATWLYDIFTRDTHRDMNQPHTRGEYYHLYINGMYWGLYQTEERCDSRYAESYYGDDNDDFDAVKADGDTGNMYAVDGTRDAYDALWSAANSGFSADSAYFAAQGMNADGTENSSYTKLLDVDNVIDYMLLIYFTANRDSPVGPPHMITMPRNLNAIYNRNDPDGFKFVAHDNEHSLEVSEGVNHNRFNVSLGTAFNSVDFFTPWWLHLKLMSNDEYALRFADHVHKHFFNGGALTATETANRVEVRKSEIYAAVVAESARWGDSKSTTPRTRNGDWLTWANWLTDTYMAQRTTIVYNQIVAKGWYPSVAAPAFNQHGGSIASGFSLSISGSSTIYYTTDGSDPREIGGSLAGTAYSSPLPLTKSTHVKARVRSGTTWSALTEATFVLNESSPLRVTEIMYNASVPDGVGTNYTGTDFEFIEIRNTGTEAVGLAGTELSEGIYFDFTDGDIATLGAGEYVVLVSDYDAFSLRYTAGETARVAGEYRGRFFNPNGALANGGEGITLKDGLGRTIQRFSYDDGWYDITDGEGFSLTLIDSGADTNTWDESASWRPSAYSGGTPGSGPVDFPAPGDLVINEALTHQDRDDPGDWVELHNTSSEAISINGWYLSDDSTNLAKVALSGLSSVPAGGYLVLTEYDHFGSLAAGENGFALSELGDTIYLSSGDGGELTGYRTEEDFDGADRDVTFGRYVKSDGDTDFPALSGVSSGSANAYPRVGPIVISEIHYQPADSNAYEFVELYNTASTNVPLHDVAIPTNTWRLDGAVEFSFPPSLMMAPGSTLIISETNAAAFTSYYTVPGGTTVLGPYDGKLNDDGESLRLERPGDPEALTGEIPEILVERVVYDDAAPWPTNAAGEGHSLRRLEMAEYANDSINWTSSSNITPGTVPGVVSPEEYALDIVSAHGTSTPAADTYTHDDGTVLTNTVVSPDTKGTTRYVCTGWALAGVTDTHGASGGTETEVVLALTDNAVLTWNWTTQYQFTASAGAHGAVNTTNGFYDLGSNASATADPDVHYHFVDWTGTASSASNTIVVVMSDAHEVVATFTENLATNGTPETWLAEHYPDTNDYDAAAMSDTDGDGSLAWMERIAGTDPTNAASVLAIVSLQLLPDHVISWSSATGTHYSLWASSNLSAGFERMQTLIPATPPMNTLTTTPGVAGCLFYRLSVDVE